MCSRGQQGRGPPRTSLEPAVQHHGSGAQRLNASWAETARCPPPRPPPRLLPSPLPRERESWGRPCACVRPCLSAAWEADIVFLNSRQRGATSNPPPQKKIITTPGLPRLSLARIVLRGRCARRRVTPRAGCSPSACCLRLAPVPPEKTRPCFRRRTRPLGVPRLPAGAEGPWAGSGARCQDTGFRCHLRAAPPAGGMSPLGTSGPLAGPWDWPGVERR